MFITVHPYRLFWGSTHRVINSDAIKDMERVTLGNFSSYSNTKITFKDGKVLKVTNSVDEILKNIKGQ